MSRLYTWIKDRLDPYQPNLVLDPVFSISNELISKLKTDGYSIIDIRNHSEEQQFGKILKLFSYPPKTPVIILSSRTDVPSHIKNSGKFNFLGRVPVEVQFDHSVIKTHLRKLSSGISSIQGWFKIAKSIGYQKYNLKNPEDRMAFSRFLENTVDMKFFEFIKESYSKLFTYGLSSDPITINRIISYLIDRVQDGDRVLLIVIDCMAWDDWFAIRDYFSDIEERSTFAVIPTITSYSRTSLLSGLLPRDFERSPSVEEEKGFYSTVTAELGEGYGAYIKNDIQRLDTQLQNEDVRIIGFIYSKFDDIIHSESVDKSYVYHKFQRLFKDELIKVIKNALDAGWRVFITSDHGNIEVFEYTLRLPIIVDTEGKRCGIVENVGLLDSQIKENVFQISGKKFKHLETNDVFIFPKKRAVFSSRNIKDVEITHGGITVEEVVVPFIEVRGVKEWY